ncbi:zinc finger protein basonuclin-2-like [Gigantopelta aegis]|uniref:zinc finger protein basonuclin-2-like n=1 Tax=Gigantopelta aegis TaxID=1735272 RepID=UPI001B88BED2|nr:zinc finger protein basonuclin-2-like [Gigantopelta aegis]
MNVEVVQPNIVFDIASLMLYGAHATPVRLKILLDRLFSVLQHEEVLQVLHGFGWSYEDYARGYILQEPMGRVLDKWSIASRDEETLIIQQFLRFGETKAIAQEIILDDTKGKHELYSKQASRADSEIKKFIERSNMTQALVRPFNARSPIFAGRLPFMTPGNRLMTPSPIQPCFSPSHEVRPLALPTSTPQPPSSPLGRLQTMQPFEYRRDQASPSVSPGTLDKSLPMQSPSDSPKNLSTTPSSVHSGSSPNQMHKNNESSEVGMVMSDDDDDHSDESSFGAIDYSTKDDSLTTDSHDRKFSRHTRKPTNPIKRQWTPAAGFGQTLIGPNGKKRVLCTACNKTFCDKGALKIHYSAVHLKEMHKCSIDGCNMMFSSRRSRNRHSANPNPKLHMPQKRKDDESRLNNNALGASPPSMVVPQSLLPHGSPIDSQSLMRPDAAFFVNMTNQLAFLHTPEKKPKLDDDESKDSVEQDEGPTDLSNHVKTEPVVRKVEEEEEEGRPDPGNSRGGSRRKSNAPTRCAQMEEMYVMSDDNSDDRDPSGSKAGCRGQRSSHCEAKVDSNGQSDPPCVKTGSSDEVAQEKECADEAVEDSDANKDLAEDKTQVVGKVNHHAIRKRNSSNFPKIASLLSSSPCPENIQGLISLNNSGRQEEGPCSPNGCSDQESNFSHSSDDGGSLADTESFDVPLDKENPRKCPTCGKIFQNQFGVKVHFQNVHLKLMHPCSVEGCGATFPSKRSRDRHSSNLNLHRKLMSTSECKDNNDGGSMQNLRDNVLQSLYGPEFVEQDAVKRNGLAASTGSGSAGSECHSDDEEEEEEDGECVLNGGEEDEEEEDGNEDTEQLDMDNKDSVVCHVCKSQFRDNLALKEHLELVHPREMFRCTVSGCDKVFSTRKSRSRHIINDNLHRHLPVTETANGLS